MIPSEVIDVQGRLADGLLNPDYVKACNLVMAIRFTNDLDTNYDHWVDALMDTERTRLQGAYSFHVNRDMTELVTSAAADLLAQQDYSFELLRSDLPTEVGFVVFDEPLRIADDIIFGDTLIKAVSWGPSPGPTDLKNYPDQFVDTGKPTAWISLTGWMAGEDLIPFYERVLKTNEREMERANAAIDAVLFKIEILRHAIELSDLDPAEKFKMEEQYAEEFAKQDIVNKAYAHAKEMVEALRMLLEFLADHESLIRQISLVPIESALVPHARMTFSWEMLERTRQEGNLRFLLVNAMWVFFHLCQQTLVSSVEEPVARPFARRWRRMPFPKRVTVVTLRRSKVAGEPQGPPGHVEWSHRWLVRGYWRMQAYGPGRTQRRPVYIFPHVKGPEGKPLVVTRKVYDLRR